MTATAVPAVRTTISTKALLTAGALAAPVWLVTATAQALTREGFDITRHPLSALSTGSLGWIQIANFLLVGALYVAGATGLRRVFPGRWTGRLVRAVGLGIIAAGVFVMDPADGFPAGTPAGMPQTMSWHSVMHLVSGTVTFTLLAAACFVIGRVHGLAGRKGLALTSRLAAVAVIVGNVWAMGQLPGASLVMGAGVAAGMAWVSATAFRSR